MNKPVLFLIFNRLSTTKRVFETIKKVKPPRLYIASDGARKDKNGEEYIVQEVRDYVQKNVIWDCQVKTLFRKSNLGCGKAVSKAITWFFENESDGIILEDDTLPDLSFFNFCEELLDYYRENKKIWHISGDQFAQNNESNASYYFAKIQHCWGWATWADRWKYFELSLRNYPNSIVSKFSEDKNIQAYWNKILEELKAGKIDTWDYSWTFNIIEHGGLCINPLRNLVSNIGFGSDGTHTKNENDSLANMPYYRINAICHPRKIQEDIVAVNDIYQKHYKIKMKRSLYNSLKPFIYSLTSFLK